MKNNIRIGFTMNSKFKFLLICSLLQLLFACDSLLRFSGKVLDEDGKPVAGAKVWLIFGNWVSESQTNADGEFKVARVHGGSENLALLISKEGKQLFFESVSYKESQMKKSVVLKNGTQSMLQTPAYDSKP